MSPVSVTEEFKVLIQKVGSDFSLTQGVGGNCSVKSDGNMVVKASGRRLADIGLVDYFYEVEVTDGQFADSIPGQNSKPSIEVFLHALLPSKYVLHLHSAQAVALSMIAATSKEIATQIIQRGIRLLPYARPGVELMESISTGLDLEDSSTFLLTNHGTLFQSESVEELSDLVTSFESFASKQLESAMTFGLDETSMKTKLSGHEAEHLRWQAEHNWRISPDHVVFLGTHAPHGFTERLREGVAIGDLLDSAPSSQGIIGPAQEQLLWFVNVSLRLPAKSFPTLSESEANFLRSWEAEKHRINLNARSSQT
jgi:ribulose-5-phosphate 4-epimerase/fuculose-1-phosphate aldolase